MSIFYNTNVKQQYFLFFVPCHVHILDKSCFFDKYETITHKRKEIEKHLLVSFQVSSGRLHLFPVCVHTMTPLSKYSWWFFFFRFHLTNIGAVVREQVNNLLRISNAGTMKGGRQGIRGDEFLLSNQFLISSYSGFSMLWLEDGMAGRLVIIKGVLWEIWRETDQKPHN